MNNLGVETWPLHFLLFWIFEVVAIPSNKIKLVLSVTFLFDNPKRVTFIPAKSNLKEIGSSKNLG